MKKKSEILLEVAEAYIQRGSNEEDMKNRLQDAAIAWNLSNLKNSDQEAALKRLEAQFIGFQGWTEEDISNHIKDMKLLIKRKKELHPNQKFMIGDTSLVIIDGEMHVTVGSMRPI